MSRFYLYNNKEISGPFDIEEIKRLNITEITLVKRENEKAWFIALNIKELSFLFDDSIKLTEKKLPKNKLASELAFIRNLLLLSFIISSLFFGICIIVFEPYKFDSKKYTGIATKVSESFKNYGGQVTMPYSNAPGFNDYLDGNIGIDILHLQDSFKKRKDYLISKSIKYSIYFGGLLFISIILLRYSYKFNSWINENK